MGAMGAASGGGGAAAGGMGSSMMGMAGGIGGGIVKYRQAKADAKLQKRIGKIVAEIARQEGRAFIGSIRIAQAKTGLDIGTGTHLEVASAAAFEAELDALRQEFGFKATAKRLRASGRAAMISGFTLGLAKGAQGVAEGYQSGIFSKKSPSSLLSGSPPTVGAPRTVTTGGIA